ncbi:MAG: glycosyltransferase family 2 protein [Elusimicrobia bacterium]|nr:glycosyltransferase family 2 protein [Elusimicrobiota bacterium]
MADRAGKVVGVIMTYNCAKFVERTYRSIPKECFDEIILADDESTDGTVEIARKLGLRVFTHPHMGYGGNLFIGLQEAIKLGADSMVELHGDGQYDLSRSPFAIDELRRGCDLVLGDRFHDMLQPLRDGMDLARYLGNIFLSTLGRVGLGIDTRDLFPGFRAYSKRFVETLDIAHTSQNYFFSFEVIAQAKYCGLRIGRVPVRCDYKQEHSSMQLYKGFPAILHTCYIVILYRLARLGVKRGIFTSLQAVKDQ